MRRVRRVDSPESWFDGPKAMVGLLLRPAVVWTALREYLGIGRRRRPEPVRDLESLQRFLDTRASFVAQTSLYGYVRTRAGMRYPELFDDEAFVVSLNAAKWQIWLACLSDIAVYAGGLLGGAVPGATPEAGQIVCEAVSRILADTGVPGDSGPAFANSAATVLDRLASCDWASVGDDASAFSESPTALVQWAPVVDELKQLDEPIVLNSVRFRWQEIRRELRQSLDAAAVLGDSGASGQGDPEARPAA